MTSDGPDGGPDPSEDEDVALYRMVVSEVGGDSIAAIRVLRALTVQI